jgi:hypothetical protein
MSPQESRALSEVLLATVADDSLVGLDPVTFDCVLHDYHSPVPWILHQHHIVPVSWTRALSMAASRVVPVCATGHEALHSAIRSMCRGEAPVKQVDEKVMPYLAEAMGFWTRHHERLVKVPGVDVVRQYATERDDEVRQPANALSRFARRLLRQGADTVLDDSNEGKGY